jgi:hypothetical protein
MDDLSKRGEKYLGIFFSFFFFRKIKNKYFQNKKLNSLKK